MSVMQNPQVMTIAANTIPVSEAARILECSAQYVRVLADSSPPVLPCVRVGIRKDRFFHRPDVETLRVTRQASRLRRTM